MESQSAWYMTSGGFFRGEIAPVRRADQRFEKREGAVSWRPLLRVREGREFSAVEFVGEVSFIICMECI